MGVGLAELFVLCAISFVLLFTLSFEGDVHLSPAFFSPIDVVGSSYAQGDGSPAHHEVVPPPLISDVDGDGVNELIVVTRQPKLRILKMPKYEQQLQQAAYSTSSNKNNKKAITTLYDENSKLSGHYHFNKELEHFITVREVGLLNHLLIRSGRQVLAIKTGYIRAYDTKKNRKQVIVVVTEGWNILCFTHKLRLLWSRSIEADFSNHVLTDVSILIDPHTMRRNDTGVVVVGGRLMMRAALNHVGLHDGAHVHSHSLNNEFANNDHINDGRILKPGKMPGSIVAEEGGATGTEQEQLMSDPQHFGREQHYSYYAFEGRTGASRWKHDSTSFQEEKKENEILKPQHDAIHSGEMDWRVFRKSILKYALPHRWTGAREDTRLDLAQFEKTRKGHDRQAKKKKRKVKSNFFVKDSVNLRPHSDSEHIQTPNAIVAHLRDGIEVLHLYSGRPLCKLVMKFNQIHVDLNGDGVIDHIEAIGGDDKHRVNPLARPPKCLAMVMSGVPVNRQLFNYSVCNPTWSDFLKFGPSASMWTGLHDILNVEAGGAGVFTSESNMIQNYLGIAGKSPNPILIAHPIALIDPNTRSKSVSARRYNSFFYMNSGMVTGLNYDGTHVWRTDSGVQWMKHEPEEITPQLLAMRPSIHPMSLKADYAADHLIITGEKSLSLMTVYGQVRTKIDLKDIVISTPVVGDFNHDGVNDIVITTAKGYYGYQVNRRLGTQLSSVLLLCLFFVLVFVFVFKLANSGATLNAHQRIRAGLGIGKRTGGIAYGGRALFTTQFRPNIAPKSAKAQL